MVTGCPSVFHLGVLSKLPWRSSRSLTTARVGGAWRTPMPSRLNKDKVAAVSLCVAAAFSVLIVLENFLHRLVAEIQSLGFP